MNEKPEAGGAVAKTCPEGGDPRTCPNCTTPASDEDRLLTDAEIAEVVKTTGLQQSIFVTIASAQNAKTAASMQAAIDQANVFYEAAANDAQEVCAQNDRLIDELDLLCTQGQALADAANEYLAYNRRLDNGDTDHDPEIAIEYQIVLDAALAALKEINDSIIGPDSTGG